MKFPSELLVGQFIKRYKRFFVDFKLEGDAHTAHVPNTGSMHGLLLENAPVKVTYTDDPKRKLKHTLQMIKTPTSWVGVNTMWPNKLAWEAWEEGRISHWKNFDSAKREYKLNPKTRLDMVLFKGDEASHFVEIKNVTLAEDGVAQFPDAKTERGQKHLKELMDIIDLGLTAEMLYVVQRTDCTVFQPAEHFDPEYSRLLREAHKKGVSINAYPVEFESDGLSLNPDKALKLEI